MFFIKASIPVIQFDCFSVSVYKVKRVCKTIIVCMWLIVLLLSFVCGKNSEFSITLLLLLFYVFCFTDNSTYLWFDAARGHTVRCISKKALHCVLIAPSTVHPFLHCRKKRRQPCWQLLLFKASLMARQFLLPLGRWLGEDEESDCDCRLWRTSQLQLTLTVPQSTHPLSSRQRHIRLCELPNWRHGCHEAVCVCERSWMMAVSSAPKRPEQETVSPAITASVVPTWCILLLKRRRRNLLQLNISAAETPS